MRFGGEEPHLVYAVAGRSKDNQPRHAVCWKCRPTGRNIPEDGITCEAERLALRQLEIERIKDH